MDQNPPCNDSGNQEYEGGILSKMVDDMNAQIAELERRVNEVSLLYSSSTKREHLKGASKNKAKDKATASLKKQQNAADREKASTKRMQELMRQFGTILRQIMQHQWSEPFMQPVDVEGLGLHDYYEVIKKPMDFSTIKKLMEAKDGSGYKNVMEICDDVRLVFKNAMTYNDEKNDVHATAKKLSQMFEKKWSVLMPKVIKEETRRKKEEEETSSEALDAQRETTYEMANGLNNEVDLLNMHLENLTEKVGSKCRMLTTKEKKQILVYLDRLSPEDTEKVSEIIDRGNQNVNHVTAQMDLNLDAQSPSTLWQMYFVVKEALQNYIKDSSDKDNSNLKRKIEISNATADRFLQNLAKKSKKS